MKAIITNTDNTTLIYTSFCVSVSIEVDPNNVVHTSAEIFVDCENLLIMR